MPEAKDCAFEKTMDRLPLEIFRDIIELLKAQLKPEQLWKLRIVSRAFSTEICRAVMRSSQFDKNFTKPALSLDEMLNQPRPMRPRRRQKYLDFASFSETLKSVYYYHRLNRPGRDSDVLWQLVYPVFQFELSAKGQKEDQGSEADRILFEVCEGVMIPDAEQYKLFQPAAKIPKETISDGCLPPRTPDPMRIWRTALAARLNRAIRNHDRDGVREAFADGARLDWGLDEDILPWFGSDHLLLAVRQGDKNTASAILTFGTFSSTLNRLDKLVLGMRTAARHFNKDMMQLLLTHPLDVMPSKSIQKEAERMDAHMSSLREARCMAYKSAKWAGAEEVLGFFSKIYPPGLGSISHYLSDVERTEIKKQVEHLEMMRATLQKRRWIRCRETEHLLD